MEHIVQFAVGIDDDSIIKYVQEHARNQIINELKKDVINKMFDGKYINHNADPKRDSLSDFTKDIVLSIIEPYKDVIVEKAAANLADRLVRTKIAKEALEEVISNE